LVIRKGDTISTLASKMVNAPRLIIIAEEYTKLDIDIEYRITSDGDLLDKPLYDAFRMPNGCPEMVTQFATG